jgi:ubiquinone/menaquinone biosynthesis C-methylase UbiE
VSEHRDRLLEGVEGRVIEVGAGNGLNFSHYPDAVSEVVAVEPEPYLRARAEEAAATAPVPVAVFDGVASQLPAEDGAFDVAVTSLVLCSVPDQHEALAEARRVLRPGGELRFYEHVAASSRPLHRFQRVLDRTIWPHVAGGCHTSRDTGAAIAAAGFEITHLERFRFPPGRLPDPVAPHVIGRAVVPG